MHKLYIDVLMYTSLDRWMDRCIRTDLSYLNLFRTGPMCNNATAPTAFPGFKYL